MKSNQLVLPGGPAGPLPDPREGRAALVLGPRVPHEAGRRAGHHHAARDAQQEGTYEVVCAELCGIGHSTMRQQVRVVPTAECDDWVEGAPARAARRPRRARAATAAGREIFTAAGCNACHTLADADATAEVGPDLDELAAVAAKREKGTSAEDYVRESIVDPPAFVVDGFPGYHARELRRSADP